jgi:NitT/TauT family transport system permease protein
MRGSTALGLGTVLAAAGTFEVLVGSGLLPSYIFVRPSTVVGEIADLFREEDLARRFLLTFASTFLAAGLATLVGVPVGWMLYRYRVLSAAYGGWIAALASAPLVLLYPLFLAALGRGEATIVAMGFVVSVVPVILRTEEGLIDVRAVLRAVGRTLRLAPAQLFWKVEFPAALPTIFAGIRLALVFALINVVGIEFLINFGGLGELIADLADRYETPAMYAAILFVILVSVLFFWATERLERWLRPA